MIRSINWGDLAQNEKEALVNRLRTDLEGGSADVSKAGDTMTGTLIVPGLVGTSLASLYQAKIGGALDVAGTGAFASNASIAQANVYSTATLNNALILSGIVLAGATVAPISLVASTPSQVVFSISGVFISTASMNAAANQTAFHIPVIHATQGVVGYIAVSKGVV